MCFTWRISVWRVFSIFVCVCVPAMSYFCSLVFKTNRWTTICSAWSLGMPGFNSSFFQSGAVLLCREQHLNSRIRHSLSKAASITSHKVNSVFNVKCTDMLCRTFKVGAVISCTICFNALDFLWLNWILGLSRVMGKQVLMSLVCFHCDLLNCLLLFSPEVKYKNEARGK